MRRPIYYGDLAWLGMVEEIARKACKQLIDAGKDLTDLSTLDEKDALMAKEDEAVSMDLVVAAIPIINNATLLYWNEEDGWELDGAVGLNKI